ncbi:uncharacterized protein LOC135477446 [Liolophura sinensis]|uniref:uncharacterized protein LOC135477446 n=1 Tax=Liolophura sinensis TaxID=3198878 RepID=UPI003158CC64
MENANRLSAQETAFLKKYFTLRKKCEQMQQANEKLVNRLQHVKKIIKKYKRERRFLVNRLEEYGDNYKDVPVPVMWEEDQLYSFLKPPPPYPEIPIPQEGLTDGLAPPISALSPGVGFESLSTVHPILAGLGVGEEGLLSSLSPTPGGSGQPKAKRMKTDKMEKDRNAPKKPANAFLMFCQQQRNTVQEEYFKEKSEEISHQELTRRLAQRWNSLASEEKRIYYEMYEREKERYDKEMKEYATKEVNIKVEDDITVNVTEPHLDILTPDLIKTELL